MDPFSSCLAFLPLALYLLLTGGIDLRRHPVLISGTLESLSVAFAVGGLVLVGPMQLFMPEAPAAHYGPLVWLFLLAFYALSVTLILLLSPPRLIVYNARLEDVQAAVDEVAVRLDPDRHWAGRTLVLPNQHVQLRLESFPPMRNISILANGFDQSHAGWRMLQTRLKQQLASVESPGTAHGAWLIFCAAFILAILSATVRYAPQTLAEGFERFLHP